MTFQLLPEQFRTMIFYNWKIGFIIQGLSCPFSARIGGVTHLPSTQSLIGFREFQRNKFTVQDAARSGRPSTSVTEQTIDAVRKRFEDDPHSTYQQIEAILGISSTSINSIIHNYLNLRQVCGGWALHTLTDDRLQFYHHSLKRFEEGWSCRVFDIITGDESCFYYYDRELKEQ